MFNETFKFVGPSIPAQVKNEDFDFTSIEVKKPDLHFARHCF